MINMIFSFIMTVGQRRILNPRRESNPLPPRYRLNAATTELRMTRGELHHFSRFACDTRPYTAIVCKQYQIAYLTFNVVFSKCSYMFLKWSTTRIMAVLCIVVEIERRNILRAEEKYRLLHGKCARTVFIKRLSAANE